MYAKNVEVELESKGRVFMFGQTIVYMKFYLEQSLIYCEICPKQQKDC